MRISFSSGTALAGVAAVSLMLAACGGPGGGGGNTLLASGGNCKQWRSEMNSLVNRGVVDKSEAAQAGRKLSASAQADVNRYNALLERYLGSNCTAN